MILDKGANVDAKNEYGRSPLHIAVEMGRLQIVRHLLEYGADINCGCIWEGDFTLLHFAVEKGYTEIIMLLLSRGANVDVKGQDGITPLHVAAKNGNIRIAEDLLNHGACIDSSTLKREYTPLHFASELDHEEAVKLLLNRGADINARTKDNSTPLYVATEKGCKRVVEVLLEHFSKVYNQDENGKTILHFAVEGGNLAIVEDVLKNCPNINNQSNRNSVKFAVHGCRKKYEGIVETLLEYGLTVNPEDAIDPKLLHAAVEKGYLEIVEDLLKYGADINASDEYGRTALHFTVEDVANIDIKVKIAKLLLSKGANINAQNNDGETTLHVAIEGGHAKVVEALLEYNANVLNGGANVNAEKKDGSTALHIAVWNGHKEVVKVLLERNAVVDSKLKYDVTPLHSAAQMDHPEIIETLLKFGADINSRDRNGRTALHIASREGYNRAVGILLEYGSDINITCKNNYTPLDYAMAKIMKQYDSDDDLFRDPDDGGREYKAVAETFTRHIVKMKTTNSYVSEQNLQSLNSSKEMSDFQDNCEKEIARMKSEKINNTKISFYDILVKDTNPLAKNMKNENIVQVVESNNYKTQFPIYAEMMEENFKKGIQKKELHEQGDEILHILFNNLPKLPDNCFEEIIRYLSDEDLKNLMYVCKPLGISNSNTNIDDVVIPLSIS